MNAANEPLKSTERATNPMQTTEKAIRARHTQRIPRMLLAAAGIVLGMASPGGSAQNTAQMAALARMSRAHVNISANNISPSGAEATSVALNKPGGLAFDAAGNLYIADTDNNIIFEVSLAGVISTVAGTGEQGFGGDGAAATSALLDSPAGVTVDASGNIYIADTHNNRIREVTGGIITTIAGTGVAGYSGDGAAATAATLSYPTAVTIDSKSNLYIADTNNHRIREITGTTIATVAGDGEQFYSGDGLLATAAGLDSPNGVAVDSAFNLYIGDTHNQRVRMVTFTTGIITTLAGTGVKGFTADGPAASAALARPRGVAVDGAGNVYVADSDNQRIRTVSSGNVTTIAGDGSQGYNGDTGISTAASLDTPRALAVAGSSVAFADTDNNGIRSVSGGNINTIAGVPHTNAESLIVSGALSSIYGTGTTTVTFSNGSQTGTGLVTFYDGEGASPTMIGTATLSGNSASISTSALSAGMHYILASYAGDANNAPIASGVYVLAITPVQLSAVANPINLPYGQAIPALTGTLSAVLAQDAGKVTAVFTSAATSTSVPGTYPITVALTGSAASNYTATLGTGSASLVIAQAPTTTTISISSGTPVAGASATLRAAVASTTSGTPSGTVSFYNGATLLNTTPSTVSGGIATLVLSSFPTGASSITAVYSGNADFLASTSATLTQTALPTDFTIAASPAAQTILPSGSANYTITLTPVNPTFVNPVTLSVSGLPAGVTATFAPSSIATGAGISTTTLTLSASNQANLRKTNRPLGDMAASTALALLLMPLAFGRRARRSAVRLSRAGKLMLVLFALAAVGAFTGCGGGGFFSHAQNSYTVTVTAVSGADTHTTNVTLTVQ